MDNKTRQLPLAGGIRPPRPQDRPTRRRDDNHEGRLREWNDWHPESYRQLRALAKLHGTLALQNALRQIENDLVAEYEAEAHRRMSESVAASTDESS